MSISTATAPIQQEIKNIFQAQVTHTTVLARSTAADRIKKLRRIENYLKGKTNFQALAEAMHLDFRKPETEVIFSEVGIVQAQITHIKKNLKRWMHPKSVETPLPMLGTSSAIHYEPKGVSLIISPWNYPFNLAMVPVVYAIAAGNAIILKPSEISANTSAFLKKMLSELFPKNEIAVIEGDASVATALLDLPFNHIFFTGSPKIGKVIMQAAAKHLASVTLELGGKSPAIIDETVNIKAIAEKTAWGKMVNNGQTCIAPDYAIVHESKKEAFIRAYGESIEGFYNPDGLGVEHSPDLARVINRRHYLRLKDLLDDAVEKGAKVEYGGKFDEADLFIAPTLLSNLNDEMRIMQEEIFGPILPLVTYQKKEDIIAIVKSKPKPLTLYIASKNKRLSNFVLAETSAGGAVVNDYLLGYSNPALPFGGINNSGIGKSLGFHGFVEFSNEKGIIKRNFGTLKMIFPPYTPRVKKIVEWLLKLF